MNEWRSFVQMAEQIIMYCMRHNVQQKTILLPLDPLSLHRSSALVIRIVLFWQICACVGT